MPLPFRLPFQRQKKPIDTQDLDGSTTANPPSPTLTKLHFADDIDSTDWYTEVPQDYHQGPEPPLLSLTRSKSNAQKSISPPVRLWQWGKRWDESVTTLIGDNDHWRLNDATWDEKIDTTPRLRAVRARMNEEQIDY